MFFKNFKCNYLKTAFFVFLGLSWMLSKSIICLILKILDMCTVGLFLQGVCYVNLYYLRYFFCFDLFSKILTKFLFIFIVQMSRKIIFGRFEHENSSYSPLDNIIYY